MKYISDYKREPFVLDSERVCFCDIDETLIIWDKPEEGDRVVEIVDPYMPQMIIKAVPHERNILLLKSKYARGDTIVIWSAGGYKWAKAVIEVLDLTDIVTLILGKPTTYIDDLEISEWGCKRLYLSKHHSKKYNQPDKTGEE